MKGTSKAERLRERVGRLFSETEDEWAPVEAAPAVSMREILRRFWPHARPYRRWSPLILVLAMLGPAVEAVGIWMFKVLVDEVLVPREFGPLGWILLAYLGITLVGGVVSFFDDYLSDWVGEKFVLSLRESFFSHVHGLSLGFFDRRKLGDVLSRLSGDITAIENLMLSGIATMLAYVFQIIFFVGALFYLRWDLALISLFVVPLFLLVAQRFSRRIKSASREQRRRAGSITAVAEESFSNAMLVQAYNRRDYEKARFRRENEGHFRAQMAATRLEASFGPLVNFIGLAGVLVVIVAGAWQLTLGNITLGGLLVFVAYLTRLYSPIQGLSELANVFYEASAGAERVIEFLDHHPSIQDRPWARPLSNARGMVEFEDVSLGYPDTKRWALERVSFRLGPGETLAIVGSSGAGKSTLAKLLLRFYDPAGGSIKLDGHDLRDLTLDSLRENVAVVLQETLVFDGTIRENIAYGKPDSSEKEISRAARAADAHEFIEKLPGGYETVIGQKGRMLSGGQRQRIAIARAMIRDAPVLILDEPTTGLDAGSGKRILEPLGRLMQGRTTTIISHNLIATRQADQIVVLEDGRITERGTHPELMLRGDAYARLYHAYQPRNDTPSRFEAGTDVR